MDNVSYFCKKHMLGPLITAASPRRPHLQKECKTAIEKGDVSVEKGGGGGGGGEG